MAKKQKRRKKSPKAQTVTQIMDEVAQEMCDKYCKYPSEWDPDEHDGMELFESEICANCPLMRLGVRIWTGKWNLIPSLTVVRRRR